MEPFIGEIRMFAGNFAPASWAFCDGSLQSIAANDVLYSLLGTTFGGDGATTFGLPDLRGRVPIHRGANTMDRVPYTMGQAGGAESVALTAAAVVAHSHSVLVSSATGASASPANAVLAAAPDTCQFYRPTAATNPLAAGHIAAGGGSSTPHENMQPYQAINYIIATAGIYPSQS